jgi:hypothetical protein
MFLAMTVKLAPQAPRMGAGTSERQQSDYIGVAAILLRPPSKTRIGQSPKPAQADFLWRSGGG